ncbi:RNA polymerase subunit sigma [Planctomycetales bacterium 10988]|nr:RNA polymerase subunit sigma [Planctomycetales bacterium 10988]
MLDSFEDALVPDLDVQQITEDYFPRIRHAAFLLTGNPWDADDLAQETFLEFARCSQRFEGRSSIYSWIYGILINVERQHRRRQGMQREKLKVWQGKQPDDAQQTSGPVKHLEQQERKQNLWAEVAELPDGQRHALVLRFNDHLSYADIAKALDCPVGTAKSRVFHGLASLKERLERKQQTSDLPPTNAKGPSHAS